MIYLREGGGQFVGPFKNRKEAERFIKLMALCGENWADTKVVEEEGVDSIAGQTGLIQ
jgi:hypothetical protein